MEAERYNVTYQDCKQRILSLSPQHSSVDQATSLVLLPQSLHL